MTWSEFEQWLENKGLIFESLFYYNEHIIYKNSRERLGVTVDRCEDWDSGEIEEAIEKINNILK